jgi:hypothetical protein
MRPKSRKKDSSFKEKLTDIFKAMEDREAVPENEEVFRVEIPEKVAEMISCPSNGTISTVATLPSPSSCSTIYSGLPHVADLFIGYV